MSYQPRNSGVTRRKVYAIATLCSLLLTSYPFRLALSAVTRNEGEPGGAPPPA